MRSVEDTQWEYIYVEEISFYKDFIDSILIS